MSNSEGGELAGAAAGSLDPFTLASGLLGGLALFLFGMDQMSSALKAVAGDRMKQILARLTSNRLMAVTTGAFITAVIQSSSVTTVLVVGFVTAGLMTLSQSIGVIFGANIGTTITAQIIAFQVTRFALPMIAAGFALLFLGKHERVRHYGRLIMGLGLIFYGMVLMGQAMHPLRNYAPFLEVMERLDAPLLGILVGAAFTALIQSSSAATGIIIVMASQGLIHPAAGVAMALGANIGTCLTTIIASIGRPREAQRAALVHVGFNVLGVLIWVPLIGRLTGLVLQFTPGDAARQIANAHTIFNLTNTILFLPFSNQFAHLIRYLLPDRPAREEARLRAKYLNDELLVTPSFALDRARLEILHMGDQVREMLVAICPAVLTGTLEELESIADKDEDVDALHGEIVTFLGRISQTELTEDQTEEFLRLLQVTNDMENIGDIIETNLVTLGKQRARRGITISETTRKVIREFHGNVVLALDASLLAVTQKNEEAARSVVSMKGEINRLAETAARHQASRLVAAEPNRLPAYTVESDVLGNFKRIYYFCKRMARASQT